MSKYEHKERLWPDSPAEIRAEDPHAPLVLMPRFSGTLFAKIVDYPIVVTAWDRRLDGRGRRLYQAAFTEAERAIIARWQTQFRKWYLTTGTPQLVTLRLATLQLLQRAVALFATI